MLRVHVKGANNLQAADRGGTSDPYCKVTYHGKTEKTEHVEKNLNPQWDKQFEFAVSAPVPGDAKLLVRVYDWNRLMTDKLIGQVDIYLRDIKRQGCKTDQKYPLTDGHGQSKGSTVHLAIMYDDPEKGQDAAGGGGGDSGGDQASAEAGTEPEVGIAEGDEDEGGSGSPRVGRASAAAKRAAVKRQKREEMLKKYPDKPLDFQVRVHIIEGRKLLCKTQPIDPVTNIFVGDENRGSRVLQDTDKPFWDEMFFFEMKKKPSEVFDTVCKFDVSHSRTLRKDALIGTFQMDLGMVYIESGHCFVHKWLLLTDPNDAQAGPRGYLKMSVMVLGPGDEPVKLPKVVLDDKCDIESNLLRPAGVQLAPATMELKVFRAEEVPRMDVGFFHGLKNLFSSKKEDVDLVDPYVEVSFAGKKVKTKVIDENANPEFNQKLSLGIKVPSMCDRIRIRIIDRDKGFGAINQDDVVGTTYIPVSEISAPGEGGFLPIFGPCFLNIYGGPRAFDVTDEYDYLNEGEMEGAAYRGRVLLQLETVIGQYPKEPVADLSPDDLVQVVPYLRRRKFSLNAVFFDATMVAKSDGLIEFEISVGNYGNKLDVATMPMSSSTQPMTPAHNGDHYYYMSWNETKPCCSVTCQWEDISYRLESLSIMETTCDHLSWHLKTVKELIDFDATEKQKASAVIQLLNQLIDDLNPEHTVRPPDEKDVTTTRLDLNMYIIRKDIIEGVRKDAEDLREHATDLQEAIEKCEEFLGRLKSVTYEAQNSFPDVIIWMLSSNKRVAYYRIPAHHLLYSKRPLAKGKLCSQMTTIYLQYHGKKHFDDDHQELPTQLRVMMWLGLDEHKKEWMTGHQIGQLAVFAETFENQSKIPIVGWGTAIGRPDWSDGLGKLSMKREEFETPAGWEWEGAWKVVPPPSAATEADSNINVFQEDVFEYIVRVPGTKWDNGQVSWGDVNGNVNKEVTDKDAIECPEGWQWIDLQWEIDINRAVDEEGWEYTVDDSVSEYSAAERMYHMCRRRRWVRTRQRTAPAKEAKPKPKVTDDPEQLWEYCKIFHTESKFHAKKRTFDMSKRRRWLRKMIAQGAADQPLFYFKNPDKKDEMVVECPRSFLTFEEPFSYELRVYLYQARDIRSGDESGMSDAYCRVSFQRRSQKSIMIPETLMPTWDQTLVFENVQLFEDPQQLLKNPPHVAIEIFDKDTIAKDDFLGRVTAPVFAQATAGLMPTLKWYPVMYIGEQQGELLAAFQLVATSDNPVFVKQMLPKPPQDKKGKYIVPSGIRPEMQRTRIEVLAWGVRDMKRYQLLSVDNPAVHLEVGGHILKSDPIDNLKKNPNFEKPHILFKSVYLPKKRIYCPPLNVRVVDHRAFGRKPLVGLHCITSIDEHRVDEETLAAFKPPPKPLPSSDEETDSAVPPTAVEPVPSTPAAEQPVAEAVPTTPPLPPTDKQPDVAVTVETVPKEVKTKEKKEEEKPEEETEIEEEKYDWWSKYYASMGDGEEAFKAGDYTNFFTDNGRLQIYDCPLEKVSGFDGLADLVGVFDLYRGKGSRDADDSESKAVGKFKATIRMYPLPEDGSEEPPLMFAHVPSTKPVPVIIRLYVIRGIDLTPKDDNGKNDAYIIVKLGKEKVDTRDNYIPNDLNPVFGSFFELKATLPVDHELKIQLKDYDLISADDLIGETVIDLENRYLTKHRATVGIADEYYINGVNQWRDPQLPSQLLAKACKQMALPKPVYSAGEVRVGPNRYNLSGLIKEVPPDMLAPGDEARLIPKEETKKQQGFLQGVVSSVTTSKKGKKEKEDKALRERKRIAKCLGPMKERLALRVLRLFGDPNTLIPEHVETRPLYSPLRPNVEQGRIQMWLDMFVDPAKNGPPPPPVNISKRRPNEYVLRLIVWNTSDVIMDETNLLGEAMSDIYIKGWLRGIDEKQKTDVHYRSLNGEGNFNWRFVFPLEYDPAEQCLVVTKKEHFWSLDKTEFRLPPLLTLQVWDADLFNPDDFLGELEINFNSMSGPAKTAKKCNLTQLPEMHDDGIIPPEFEPFNLFERRHVRGWWPFKGQLTYPDEVKGTIGLTGKIEMELELVTKEEAEARPAGPARDDPNMNPTLEPPNRPDTSFLWFMNPWKTCKHILWKRLKWLIITLLIVIVIVAFVVLFFYNFPQYTVKKLIGS
ncbi:myoferlin-like isoform X2 [Corticium candelabrum]|uniref:myoferlin-like isoform X2 n=1 Tax=Corticium candelabrum TaxID=121492 RepID=UPI002E25AA49|nr:myoferlin-like isoform X2 [Corticium candelabrum]